MVEKSKIMKTFDDLIEFTSIQKEFTANTLKYKPDQSRSPEQQIKDVLINKILDFTIQSIGVSDSLEYINSRYSAGGGVNASQDRSISRSNSSIVQQNSSESLKGSPKTVSDFTTTKDNIYLSSTKLINKVYKFNNYVVQVKYADWIKTDLSSYLLNLRKYRKIFDDNLSKFKFLCESKDANDVERHQDELMRFIKLKDDKQRSITSELNIQLRGVNLAKLADNINAIFHVYSDLIICQETDSQFKSILSPFQSSLEQYILQLNITDQIIQETYRYLIVQGNSMPQQYEFEMGLAPYNNFDQQSIRNLFVSYPSQSVVSSQMSEIDLNFKAEKIIQSEHSEKYSCVVSSIEGKARFIIATNTNKLLVYNEKFTSQKTFVIASQAIAGVSNREKFYLALENQELISMNAYTFEIKELGKTTNQVVKLVTFKDKFLLAGEKDGLIDILDIKRGKVMMQISLACKLQINDLFVSQNLQDLIIAQQGITIYELKVNSQQKLMLTENQRERYLEAYVVLCMAEVSSDQMFAFAKDQKVFYQIDRSTQNIFREIKYQDQPMKYLNSLLLSDPTDNLKPLILIVDTQTVTLYNGISKKAEILMDLQFSGIKSNDFITSRVTQVDNELNSLIYLVESQKDRDQLLCVTFEKI
ncbi:UNKNOWN [Stylonychia lemnae]|uniref:Uncharacterized protein n=1 Tax=Stylonychia lemnae TaxID=5949 RepID=A0A078A9C7_STYLE|nr:UNKNOWN [Stylonychia lemnae]|eukprot:CDW77383.1 UNKNOWN [Stylonychia lemnae]